jgi:N-acetylneuraminic acid mutarotase
MIKNFTLILSALILIACIQTNTQITAATPIEDSWATKTPMSQARADFGLVAVGDKIYAIGGSTSNSWRVNPVATNEEYDPKTDIWTTKTAMPTPRARFAIAAYGNLIYCIGGVIGQRSYVEPALNGLEVTAQVSTKAIEVYNTTSGTWESKKNATTYLGAAYQTHVINDSIYFIGIAHTYVYNVKDESWSTKSRMPTYYYASQPVSTVIDGKMLVAGEFEKQDSKNSIFSYDPATDNWTKTTSCPFTYITGIATTTDIKAPKFVYVFGVYYPEGSAQVVTQAYDLEKGTWRRVASIPSGRGSYDVAVVNDMIYAIGGNGRLNTKEQSAITNIVEQYTPIGYSTPPTITLSSTLTKTYNQSSISLNFTLDKAVSWTGYSLDNQANVTFTDNLNLTNLPNGNHNLTIYANDTYGTMGSSEITYFTVDVPAPFPIELAVIAAIAVGVTVAIFVIYRRRSKP